ncbi:Rrf2 family protein [Pseudoxanthobacter soli DSM 19599]|uniref:Rrf2 family protein n=1 Tax=Pseudoxanthobacter soli DSM 19599 TaxID=1123029 RepID=A0A1M7ZHQ9_9HYPH|nr:Rrf2 family protein [Pseudoxanthobacter soli DSM 19599]
MKRDSRLSGVLHVLLHMAEARRPVTSEAMAKAMRTNPVVIRRIMAGLREAGFVRSDKGHGGGWTIARTLDAITLRDIYTALGEPELLAMGNRTEAPGCLVEQAVNAALDEAFREAERVLLDRFGAVTLAALAADFHARMIASGRTVDLETSHEASDEASQGHGDGHGHEHEHGHRHGHEASDGS